MKTSYSILATLLLCFTTAASAEVYRWVDSQGRVQYSDQPPPGTNSKKVDTKPATGSQSSPGAKSYQEQDQAFRKRRVEEEEVAKKTADADKQASIKQKNCAAAKSQLASLQNTGRVATTNAKGEREFLDDKGREAAIADAKQAAADWCK